MPCRRSPYDLTDGFSFHLPRHLKHPPYISIWCVTSSVHADTLHVCFRGIFPHSWGTGLTAALEFLEVVWLYWKDSDQTDIMFKASSLLLLTLVLTVQLCSSAPIRKTGISSQLFLVWQSWKYQVEMLKSSSINDMTNSCKAALCIINILPLWKTVEQPA